jgi:hypothetical protein
MPAVARILDVLCHRLGKPQSVAEIAQALPDVAPADVEATVNRLRRERKLAREGAGTPDQPYRFHLTGEALRGLYRYVTAPGRWWVTCCGEDGRHVNIIRSRYEQMGLEPLFEDLPIAEDDAKKDRPSNA